MILILLLIFVNNYIDFDYKNSKSEMMAYLKFIVFIDCKMKRRYKCAWNVSSQTRKRRFNAIPIHYRDTILKNEQTVEDLLKINSQEPDSLNLSIDSTNNLDLSEEEQITLSDVEDEDYSSEFYEEKDDMESFLRGWISKYNIKANAVDNLLKFLHNRFTFLPRTSRTLMKTPTCHNIIEMEPGQYIHIGLKLGLDYILESQLEVPQKICLNFNIDGVPISKSSRSCFWLILANPKNISKTFVFVVGIYHGFNKPKVASDFLRPFVDDLKVITSLYTFKDHIIKVEIGIFVFDAPAKSMCLGIKSHAGYFSCSKCTIEGDYYKNRVVLIECNCSLRTNESFRNKTDEYHHNNISPLEELDIDMVDQVPLDYLHVVCLGVVKRFLNIWVNGSPPHLLPSASIEYISNYLKTISFSQPTEFQRRVRPLGDLGHFKGTEFRTLLLYTLPVVLRKVLSEEKYNHFMLLHVGITILCSKRWQSKADVAKQILIKFVEETGRIYGKEHLIYNVHSLIHLADDVKLHGPCDSYSAFLFESHMFFIKCLLRKNDQPLQQLCNRILENYNILHNKQLEHKYPILRKSFDLNNETAYREIVFENMKISNNSRNEWFSTKNKHICKFHFATKKNNEIFVNVTIYTNKGSFFNIPIDSQFLGIHKFSEKESLSDLININDIDYKLFVMQNEDGFIAYPLIHL